ncbi:hypothetical protein A0H76_287 [Hepatospora eriocheir]|uniref:Uncharacterized protein n=1 Tax=Hepatospora eriocheir TaxID=1081669 RepID=A0A1X0QCX3_9MICR|nr:hypothetical protein A0H76_287 [Hepatospora eriocheir]ORD97715.1 hypothetical protein HERIO_415 [Hepatospora eriocheir]
MSKEDNDLYHPGLFDKEDKSQIGLGRDENLSIPQNSLYESTVIPQHKFETRHVTVFGFSLQNRTNIIEKINHMVNATRVEEGKNYLSIWCDDISELEELIKLNQTIHNGEIIGAFRVNFGTTKNDSIYAKRSFLRSLFDKIF